MKEYLFGSSVHAYMYASDRDTSRMIAVCVGENVQAVIRAFDENLFKRTNQNVRFKKMCTYKFIK